MITLEVIFIIVIILYLLYDILLITAVNFIPVQNLNSSQILPISIVIASRNEAKNLETNLIAILNQKHSNFEVIIIDDQSTDNTFEVIRKLMLSYPQLAYFKIDEEYESSKKNAITKGIGLSNNDYLIFTDADCKPLSEHWLTTIQNYFVESPSAILGYSPYQKTKGNLNKLIRFETYQTAVNYFGFAQLGSAYMGVGRNLGYTKSLFIKSGGFKAHKHILSGDDDLLINQISGKYPISCCLVKESYVESKPKDSLEFWVEQKRRHYTTSSSYKLKHQLLLSFQFSLKFLLWFIVLPSSILLLFLGQYLLFSLFIIVMLTKLMASKSIYEKLMVRDLWLQSFTLEFQLVCMQLYIFSLNLFSLKQKW